MSIKAKILKIQKQIDGVSKDGSNPHFKSRYVTLDKVLDTIKPLLNNEGILITQGIDLNGTTPVISTVLTDVETNEVLSSSTPVIAKNQDPQAFFAATTYARRYSILSLFCLGTSDDDGETAMGRNKFQEELRKKKAELEKVTSINIPKNTVVSRDPVPTIHSMDTKNVATEEDPILVVECLGNQEQKAVEIREQLKKLGFRFNADKKSWFKQGLKSEFLKMSDELGLKLIPREINNGKYTEKI